MNRICVIGCGGAGKSTFSTQLSKRTKLPLIHLDTIFWQAGWVEKEQSIFDKELAEILEKDKWIIDGNFSRTMPARFQKSDTIFFLDYSALRCIYGVFKRLITYHGRWRPDMTEGCTEGFDWEFLKYVLFFRTKSRPKILQILKEHAAHCKIIVFNHPSELKAWLEKNS